MFSVNNYILFHSNVFLDGINLFLKYPKLNLGQSNNKSKLIDEKNLI